MSAMLRGWSRFCVACVQAAACGQKGAAAAGAGALSVPAPALRQAPALHPAVAAARGFSPSALTFASASSGEGEDKGKAEGAQEEAAATEAGGEQMAGVAADGDSEIQDALEAVQAELNETKATLEKTKEAYLRQLADMENLRVRTSRDVESGRKYAIQKFAEGLLEVTDNLDRALTSVPQHLLEADAEAAAKHAEEVAKNLRALYNGVDMSQKIMHKVLSSNGIERVVTEKGEEFDPHTHDAMFEQPTKDMEPGRVVEVVKQGYTLNDRVLRAAVVAVSRAVDPA